MYTYKITPEKHDIFVKMWRDGATVIDIAKEIQVSRPAAYNYINRYPKIFKPRSWEQLERNKITPQIHNTLKKLHKEGLSPSEMASRVNRSPKSITKHIKENINDFPTSRLQASDAFRAKVIRLWNDGLSARLIAEKLKIKKRSVENIVQKSPECTRRRKAGVNKDLFLDLWNKNTPKEQIAERFNISISHVYWCARKFEAPKRQVDHSQKRRDILTLLDKNMSPQDVAKKLNIPVYTVYYYRKHPSVKSTKRS